MEFKKIIKWTLMAMGALLAGLALFVEFFPFDHHHCGVSRVRSDHRSLATAIETYKIDMGAYPIAVPMIDFYPINDEYSRKQLIDDLDEYRGTNVKAIYPGGDICAGLTTPIAYVTNIFPDPFALQQDIPFAYETANDRWILYSPGPDLDYDIQNPVKILSAETDYELHRILRQLYSYDPSNGVVSNGDYWRVNY